jgi:low temperature requirement protein LtrA
VVAVGIGLGTDELPLGRIVTALLGLALVAGLWWLYFNGEEERAQAAIEAAPMEKRPWLALKSFGYVFLLILGAIVVIAAGMKIGIVHYDRRASLASSAFLAGGVAAYLIGLVLFRWVLSSGPLAIRLLLAALTVPTVLLGTAVSPVVELLALVIIVVGGAATEQVLAIRRLR